MEDKGNNEALSSSTEPKEATDTSEHSENANTINQGTDHTQKKKRNRILPAILIAIRALIANWYIYRALFPAFDGPRISPLNLVPSNAFFIMETDQVYGFWSKMGQTQIWKTLTKDDDWKSYGEQLTSLEETLADFDQLLENLNHRKVYISDHLYYKGDYDYLFLLDMGAIAHLPFVTE